MANVDFQVAWDQAKDAGFQKRVQIAISATGMSIASNSASSPARVALAKSAVDNSEQTAARWAYPVRVSGTNISVATALNDDQISAGVEGVFSALAGA